MEEVKKEELQKKSSSKTILIGLFLAILSGLILSLFFTEWSKTVIITIILVMLILGAFTWFGKSIAEKMKVKAPTDDFTKIMSRDDAINLMDEEIMRMFNQRVPDEKILIKAYTVNRNLIYLLKAKLQLEERFDDKLERDVYFVINANYKNIMPSILKGSSTEYEIMKTINAMSSNPEKEPDMREIVARNHLTGNEIVTKETIHKSEEAKEEKKEEVA